jgi:tetrapyrrole methylase family protein/MazG family protein
MIRRHPHVFGEKEVDSSAEVIQNWFKIKLNEKKNQRKHSQLDSVPLKLPALLRAYRILDRVAHSGFDFRAVAGNPSNAEALAGEIQAALNTCDRRLASRKFGDLLFALINVARLADIHAERALAGSVKKFEARFKKMEALVNESQLKLDEISLEEKKRIWEKVQKIFP